MKVHLQIRKGMNIELALFTMLTLSIFEPTYLSYTNVHYFFAFIKMFNLLYLVKYVRQKTLQGNQYLFTRKMINGLFILIILVSYILYLNQTATIFYILNLFETVSYCIGYCTLFEKYKVRLPSICLKIVIVLLMVNLLFYYIYPQGLLAGRYDDAREWFLGTKNSSTKYLIFGFLNAQLMYIQCRKKENSSLFFIAVMAGYSAIFDSMTALLCMTVVFVLLSLKRIKNIKKTILFVILLIALLLTLMYLTNTLYIFWTWFMEFFNKGVTISGRFAIWEQAIVYIAENPFIGKGIYIEFAPWTNLKVVYSAHNLYLDFACRYGIVCLALLIFQIVRSLNFVVKDKSQYSYILVVTYITFILYSMVEVAALALTFYLIVVSVFLCEHDHAMQRKIV